MSRCNKKIHVRRSIRFGRSVFTLGVRALSPLYSRQIGRRKTQNGRANRNRLETQCADICGVAAKLHLLRYHLFTERTNKGTKSHTHTHVVRSSRLRVWKFALRRISCCAACGAIRLENGVQLFFPSKHKNA